MTKPKPPSKARRALLRLRGYVSKHCLSLCWGTYTLGVIWLFLHPAVTVTTGELKCRGTYMSENALLIDLMEARANHQEANAARNLHQNMVEMLNVPPTGCGENCSQVVDWIGTQMRDLDVEAYTQSFQTDVNSPARQNVYGILRASPLADGKEALVLVTHYRNVGSESGDYSGLSLGLALLKYLARAKWLAKDVILLVADDGVLDGSDGYAPGTEAWLQAYHLDPVESGLQGVLPMRAGVIRAAVNLETMIYSHNVDSVGIYTAGMNGQLPNLDLVNTAVRSFREHHIPTILDRADTELHGGSASYVTTAVSIATELTERYGPLEIKQKARDYLSNLKGMLHFMTTLASGPSGPHANFISYNIDSITLSLTKRAGSNDQQLAAREVLRSIEMVVRALSNLEEKLHQSFFLYVLPNTATFVSVGEYYYTVALAISPAIAHLLKLPNQMSGMRVAFALTVFLVVEALSAVLLVFLSKNFTTPIALLGSANGNALPTTRWWVLAAIISVVQVLVVLVVVPALRSITGFSGCVQVYDWRMKITSYEAEQAKKELKKGDEAAAAAAENNVQSTQIDSVTSVDDIPKPDSGWRAVKFLAMALLVYGHCILGILNYPMALFCAIPMTHFSRVVPFSTVPLAKNIWNGLWLLMSSPLVLLVLLNWSRQDIATSLSNAVDSFVLRSNLLVLPYICCIYVAVHTLSLVAWTFPATNGVANSGTKRKQE